MLKITQTQGALCHEVLYLLKWFLAIQNQTAILEANNFLNLYFAPNNFMNSTTIKGFADLKKRKLYEDKAKWFAKQLASEGPQCKAC